jgi:lincosamide nucleotidyltransferase A/C/D/E
MLGKQSRPHKDLDIAIEDLHLVRFEQFLASQGYRRAKREIEKPFNFVLADHTGRQIDVHVISVDERGNGIYGPPERGVMYPADSLTGSDTIDDYPVRCISARWMVKFHSSYELNREGLQRCFGNLREIWHGVAGRVFSLCESALIAAFRRI